jgi:Ca2+-binding EF-hand superfamily protein
MTSEQMKIFKKPQGRHPHLARKQSGSSENLDLKEQIEMIFSKYDLNQDGILDFSDIEKILEDGKTRRLKDPIRGEDTI